MWVLFQVIGSGVVLIVLSYPPGPAQAHQETAAKTDEVPGAVARYLDVTTQRPGTGPPYHYPISSFL